MTDLQFEKMINILESIDRNLANIYGELEGISIDTGNINDIKRKASETNENLEKIIKKI